MSFKKALSQHGTNISEISHASEEHIMSIVTSTLKFSHLDALRIVNIWHERVSKTQTPAAKTPKKEDFMDMGSDPQPPVSPSVSISDVKRGSKRRLLLDVGSPDYNRVCEVLKLTTTCGDGSFEVNKIFQLKPSKIVNQQYNTAKTKLEEGSPHPKVLYYAGLTLPSISEIMESGFAAEMRRSKCLLFSTEANIDAAAKSAGDTVMLLLCEVLVGRVTRISTASTAALYRIVNKYCGPYPMPSSTSPSAYPADTVGMDYTYYRTPTESATATKYALHNPQRVIPRYLVYLSVKTTARPAAPVILSSPRRNLEYGERGGYGGGSRQLVPMTPPPPPPAPLLTSVSFDIMENASIVMCPIHPSEELVLYCVDDEELRCKVCADSGRRVGKRYQQLSELLANIQGHLAVQEKQIATKIVRMEAGIAQLQSQGSSLREAEHRARRQIRQKTSELIDDISNRREILEASLSTKAAASTTKIQGSLQASSDYAACLRQAHEKLRMLSDARYSGVSARAADVIVLSKLLDRCREQPSMTDEFSLGMTLTDEINSELSRLRLPPSSYAAAGIATPRSQASILATSPSRRRNTKTPP
eukprot:TRINITY_DN3480_c0_g1_i1.p1 TRINITY_DN3480_c0_g1~~TRINITY_DN3480_c0_g1_i1.p1  ORF type:complete len:588 (+),score=96.22 TRINITY_DN3480_c0_g1_i1:675-2438(+)